MTVTAAALQSTDELKIRVRIFGRAIGLIALIQTTVPGTSAFDQPIFEPRSRRLER